MRIYIYMHLHKCKYQLTLAFENKPYHVAFVMLHPKISPSNHYLDLNSWSYTFTLVYMYIQICVSIQISCVRAHTYILFNYVYTYGSTPLQMRFYRSMIKKKPGVMVWRDWHFMSDLMITVSIDKNSTVPKQNQPIGPFFMAKLTERFGSSAFVVTKAH